MAYRIANADTTLSSVTGWDTVTNTPTIHASTNITVSTSAQYTQGFTAPNLVNKCTGVALLLITKGSYTSGNLTLTVTLQENSVDTAATKTITINTTGMSSFAESNWIYVRFPTPYTFTSTTAGYYRFKIVRGTATNAPTLRADSVGSNFAFMATDDRVGAIASTDDLFVLGVNYSNTTVTLDGTVSIGSGLGALTLQTSSATLSAGLYVGSYGIVTADTTANVSITCKGHLITGWNSTVNVGSSGTPYDKKFTFTFNPTTHGDFGFRSFNGSVELWGEPKSSTTLWNTTFSSGLGTAASPLVVSDSVDWSVDDQIAILASSDNATNYNEVEYRYIKTKNSATSYVLSNTVGGAEAALTYTHTNARVVNIERNIVFTTTDTSKATYFGMSNSPSSFVGFPSFGSINVQWTRFENTGYGSTAVPMMGICFDSFTTHTFDYCVAYNPLYCGYWGSNSTKQLTINGYVACKAGTNASYLMYGQAFANKTFNDTFLFDGNTSAYGLVPYGSVNTFNGLIMNSIRKSATVNGAAALYFQLATSTTFNNMEINCCGLAISFPVTSTGNVFNDCLIGTKGKNLYDMYVAASCLQQNRFTDCIFNSNTFWASNSYTSLIDGSEVIFENFNTTTLRNLWYSPNGIVSCTGDGLPDTLVRTPGSNNVRLAPENNSPGLTWSFLIPANKNQVCAFSGYFLKNVAMGTSVCTVSLFLPGNPTTGTPDATYTLTNDVSNAWTGSAVQAVSLAAYYTGTVDTFATIVINAKSTTAGAYLYCADFYNSGDASTLYDKLAGLTIWYQGKPSLIITQLNLGGIAPAVWAVATSGLTSAGTTGKKLVDNLTYVQSLQ